MFTKAITIQIAAALFAVAVAATPALARGGGGDAGSSAGSSAGSNSGGGDAGRSGGFSSGGGSERGAAPSAPSGARANSQRYGNVDHHSTSGVSHHGHGHHGRHAGNGFSFFDFSPGYASYSYDESPRCYRRHVRVHHHWVWRQYCRY